MSNAALMVVSAKLEGLFAELDAHKRYLAVVYLVGKEDLLPDYIELPTDIASFDDARVAAIEAKFMARYAGDSKTMAIASHQPTCAFIKHLIDIGAIPHALYQKVVIEADVKAGFVRIYTQQVGTFALLNVQFVDTPVVVEVK